MKADDGRRVGGGGLRGAVGGPREELGEERGREEVGEGEAEGLESN